MNNYAIYLRKSRADLDAEARGEGETLAKHRKALWALAERRGLNVVHEYAELVTGDSIAARPQMQALLEDVKHGTYAGVIVNDVDRLGRGDSIDQEIIKVTFAAAHCIIITPMRDINPASPSDEDMLDFSLFFARFEYRKIAQRLRQGRTRSAASGNYIAARVPYGYRKTVEGNRITLAIDEETAAHVRMMFNWYASRKYGYMRIAEKLNEMGLRTYRGYPFNRATVKAMLTNPVYTGRIIWGRTTTISTIEEGKRIKKHVKGEPQIVENAHPAIISDELFEQVQDIFKESRHANPTKPSTTLANPLAGLIFCSQCGHALQLVGGKKGKHNDRVITCINRDCDTRGAYLRIIVETVLEILESWCADYQEPSHDPVSENPNIQIAQRQIAAIEAQLTKAQELVELGVYTPSEYIKRRNTLQENLQAAKNLLIESESPTQSAAQAIHAELPEIRKVLDAYPMAKTVEQKNALLHSIIQRIEYSKTEVATKGTDSRSLIKLTIYPRIGNIM